jgi:restriction system protein
VVRWVIQRRRQRAREQLLLTDAISLTPSDFERRVQLLLQDLGWEHVEHVGGAGDGGVDLRGRCDGHRYIVQCKRYKGIVSPTHIRDLAGALEHEAAERALLVTTGRVSHQARAWIGQKSIEIWDGEVLAQQIRLSEEAEQAPERTARNRQRTRRFFGVLAGANILTLLLAISIPGNLMPISVTTQQRDTRAPRDVTQRPTRTLRVPTRQAETTAQPSPVVTGAPELTAVVANGGNIRAEPTLQGTVLDQVHARETVVLLAQTNDGAWYQISDARAVVGWVHKSLLRVDQLVGAQVPTTVP